MLAVLTVEAHKANSHKNKGWEQLTDTIIQKLNEKDEPVVFILWGRNARDKKQFITNPKHLKANYYHLDSMSQEELVALYNLIKASTLAEIAKMDITFEDTDNDTLYRATSIKRHTDYIDFASNNEGQLIAVSLNSEGTLS